MDKILIGKIKQFIEESLEADDDNHDKSVLEPCFYSDKFMIPRDLDSKIDFSDEHLGLLEISISDYNFVYLIKPLKELYESEDASDEDFSVLLNFVGSVVTDFLKTSRDIDHVYKTLEQLGLKPEMILKNNLADLGEFLTLMMSYFLSINAYSRKDLRRVYRSVLKIVKRS